jgi:hypothetical protein
MASKVNIMYMAVTTPEDRARKRFGTLANYFEQHSLRRAEVVESKPRRRKPTYLEKYPHMRPVRPNTRDNNTLYRFYDKHGVLIYVGITCSLNDRIRQHSQYQVWWREVVDAKFEHFDSRAQLEDAELQAIRSERPRYNRRGLPT